MKALDRKLLRDLGRIRGQALTIALVVACGLSTYVSSIGAYRAFQRSRTVYYAETRFGDVFVSLDRAPETVRARLAAIPGVVRVDTRIVRNVLLDVHGLREVAMGHLVSLPVEGNAPLNQLQLRAGRLPEPGAPDEVTLSDRFAIANHLGVGSTLPAVINEHRVVLHVVGTAASPEFVYATRPGDIVPDDHLFGVLWLRRNVLANAYDERDSFDDAVFRLDADANVPAVRAEIDRLLVPYGGLGAIARERQPSDFIVSSKIAQLRSMATILPAVFLGVAAFLVNVVLSRIIATQREQIASLKALGYSDLTIARHYLELVLVITLGGAAGGTLLGIWMGRGMVGLYGKFFGFPVLAFRLDGQSVLLGVGISIASGALGMVGGVMRSVTLPPAEAMRPEAPTVYRRSILDRLGLLALLSPLGRMVARDITRRPVRLALSSTAIAFAAAILVTGRFSTDSINHILEIQFGRAQREDVTITFIRGERLSARDEIARLPGVRTVEALRTVPVRVRVAQRDRTVMIEGVDAHGTLRRLIDADGHAVTLSDEGVAISRRLADALHVHAGETVRLEVLEGARGVYTLPVSALIDDMLAFAVYMNRDGLHRLLDERPVATAVVLTVDPLRQAQLFQALQRLPAVAGITRSDSLRRYFREDQAKLLTLFTIILSIFAGIIAVGVVYNNARIALALRARELASLRILGYTRGEVSAVLLSEQAVQLCLGVPLGLWVGRWMAFRAAAAASSEVFAVPAVLSATTYALAATVVFSAGVFSALLVRRQVDQLDLVSVLKARD